MWNFIMIAKPFIKPYTQKKTKINYINVRLTHFRLQTIKNDQITYNKVYNFDTMCVGATVDQRCLVKNS